MSLFHTLLLLLPIAQAQIILSHSGMIVTRLDPIVSRGKVAGHMHSVVGGSRFASTFDSATILDASCNDMGRQTLLDKSNYWSPTLYWQWNDGTFSQVPFKGAATYYLNRGNGDKIEPFPVGFSMMGGDPNRRNFDPNNVTHKAASFVCVDGTSPQAPELWGYKNNGCYSGIMRMQINMPQCSDGRATSDDNSHVSYAMGNNPDNGRCPASHPHHLISLFYEMDYTVTPEMTPSSGKYVLSQGDPTGYGMHGDFTNGWDQKLLEDMIDQCFNKDIGTNGGFDNCPPLVAAQKGPDVCKSEGQKADEDVGLDTKLKALPGCNPIWDGTGERPSCSNQADPAIIDLASGQTVIQGGMSGQGSAQNNATQGGAGLDGYMGSSAASSASPTDGVMTDAVGAATIPTGGSSITATTLVKATKSACLNKKRAVR